METIGKRREGKKVGGGEKKAMKNGNLRFDETTGPVFLERAKPSETNQTRETRGETRAMGEIREAECNVTYLTKVGKGMYGMVVGRLVVCSLYGN